MFKGKHKSLNKAARLLLGLESGIVLFLGCDKPAVIFGVLRKFP